MKRQPLRGTKFLHRGPTTAHTDASNHHGRRAVPQRRGAAVVEFALVAPIFFMLVLGIIEVGRAMMVQQILVNASRVGARRAAMLFSNQAAVIDAVDDYLDGVSIHGETATITPDPSSATAGSELTVTVSVPYSSVTWLPAAKFMAGKTLTSSSVMRKEGF